MNESWGIISSLLALLVGMLALLRDTFEVTLKWSESHNFLKRLFINRRFQLCTLFFLLALSFWALYSRIRSLEITVESQAQAFKTVENQIESIESSLTNMSSKLPRIQDSIAVLQAQSTQLGRFGSGLSAKEVYSATTIIITNTEGVSIVPSSTIAKDFSASARFFNPYDGAQKIWSYGLTFRSTDTHRHYLIVQSIGSFQIGYWEKGKDTKYYPKVQLVKFNSGAEMYNDIHLDVVGQRLQVRLNGVDAGTIDLDELAISGGISLMAGYYSGEDKFENVRVENFTISLP